MFRLKVKDYSFTRFVSVLAANQFKSVQLVGIIDLMDIRLT